MFKQRRNSNMLQAAGTTLALIYHQTVYNLRNSHRNALVGLGAIILQSAVIMVVLMTLYLLIGVRTSPIRGDFMLYIMSGIFVFMTHVQTAGAVSGSHSISAGMVKHEPLNAAILISGAACAMLYRQMISCVVILSVYHLAFEPITIHDPVGAMALLLLSWFSGIAVGMIFLGIKPWSPALSRTLTTFYSRVNMFASGKMFVANTLPNFMLPWFIWNPLFHLIDQERGFLFINYSPHKTWLLYPLWVTLACFMVALLINFTTRKYESVSWSAAH
ncbi:ABC transporter permease [Paracoccus beibuensis]|uniref:ABC transporter permease n=1 Tax=Paracoccus beibuensis TaxID=547602 RepID=UPI002240CD6B|nr:ABC transporter [Paracoccus beibuensis]